MVVLHSRVRVRVRYDKFLGERGLIRMGWDNTHEEGRVVVILGIGLGLSGTIPQRQQLIAIMSYIPTKIGALSLWFTS